MLNAEGIMAIKNKEELASYIDHTILKSTAVTSDIEKLCAEAVEHGFGCVCVQPRWVSLAVDILARTNIKIDSVAGFPFGAETPTIKAAQAREVIMAGADEVDMVADLAAIIEGDRSRLVADIESVLKVCRSFKPVVALKVIIEAAALSDEQIKFVCEIASALGVDFVKTSTGYNAAGGATVEDVTLMAQSAPGCKVKASGGIRTAEDALAMIEAGASRIGTSASVAIIEGFETFYKEGTTNGHE
jgi:deoxyribose-phosphate aldolase